MLLGTLRFRFKAPGKLQQKETQRKPLSLSPHCAHGSLEAASGWLLLRFLSPASSSLCQEMWGPLPDVISCDAHTFNTWALAAADWTCHITHWSLQAPTESRVPDRPLEPCLPFQPVPVLDHLLLQGRAQCVPV